MKRSELIKSIAGIYNEMNVYLQSKALGSELGAIAQTLTNVEVMVSKRFAAMGDLCVLDGINLGDTVKIQLEALIAHTSAYIPENQSPSEVSGRLAGDYMSKVCEFNNTGGVGYYDTGAVIQITHDLEVAPVLSKLAELGEQMDVKVYSCIVKGNPDSNLYMNSATIGVAYPSSLRDFFIAAMAEFINKDAMYETQKTVSYQEYFVTPFLSNPEASVTEQVAIMKEVVEDNISDGHSGWAFEEGLASIGCARFAFNTHETLAEKIELSLTLVQLYSKYAGEHVNGVMPTSYCYDDEIEQYGLSTTGFEMVKGFYNKPVNLIDEIKIYHAMNA